MEHRNMLFEIRNKHIIFKIVYIWHYPRTGVSNSISKVCPFFFFFFGRVGSQLLHVGFLQLRQAGTTLRCSAQASHCGGISCCGVWALGAQASVVAACALSSCGSRPQLLQGMWDLPRPGIEPVSPALAGRFLTTVPPGKSCPFFSDITQSFC